MNKKTENLYEKAVLQSKKMRREALENQKNQNQIESSVNQIDQRIAKKDLIRIESGFQFKNGNTLSLVEPLPKTNNSLLDKFNRVLKLIKE